MTPDQCPPYIAVPLAITLTIVYLIQIRKDRRP